MPYEGEYAGYKSLHRIAKSERVSKLLGGYKIRRPSGAAGPMELKFQPAPRSDWKAANVIAIDGSHLEVDVENGFPGAEASYLTLACVFLDVERMVALDEARPVDPREFRALQATGSIDCALPGCNVVIDGEPTAPASLRRTLYEILDSEQAFTDCESLLETYEALLAYKPIAAREQRCPFLEDCPLDDGEYVRGKGKYLCACTAKRPLYSSDALRIHEGMIPFGKNGAMFAEIMQVLERLWVVHVLRVLEARNWLSTLRRLAIVLDGPLAVFGHPAWLSPAISKELNRINAKAREVNHGNDLLLIGIEKTGVFPMHLDQLDQTSSGAQGKIEPRTYALVSDAYIKRNIIPSDSSKPYGADTYFGRKLFYKTRTGARIVATLPFLEESHRETQRADADQYPRLADALRLLDDLFSSRYPNALAPLVAAHSEAAIPLNLGRRVLEKLARDLMKEDSPLA